MSTWASPPSRWGEVPEGPLELLGTHGPQIVLLEQVADRALRHQMQQQAAVFMLLDDVVGPINAARAR